MKVYFTMLFSILFFFSWNCYSQQYDHIKIPGESEKCRKCIAIFNAMPKEILLGIHKDLADNLYFIFSKKEWFDMIFNKKDDGIAIDIVSKERFDCTKENISTTSQIRGDLQPPVYLKELQSNMTISENGSVVIDMGPMPKKYKDKDVEFNVLILKRKNLCRYIVNMNIKSYRWDLLDMGLYFDTLVYKSTSLKEADNQEKYILQHKTLKFEIPFERNKSAYSNADIKPLYDSLNITDFNIRKITIRAYSSIEGNREHNLLLQQERAQSIANALQSFQNPGITTEIQASENWVDILGELSESPYAYLTDLSQTEMRDKLKDTKLKNELEPYFQKQRKAIVILELEKKNKFKKLSSNELVDLFSKSISEKNLKDAILIQNSIFEKVRNHEIPVSTFSKLEIPRKNEFGLLQSNHSLFRYMLNDMDVVNTIQDLTTLLDLIPNDGHTRYNICALKFKIWVLGQNAIDPIGFKKEINNLKNWGIPQNLIKRMLINYEIIMCEYYMNQGNFVKKDNSLKFILANYKSVLRTDNDYLSLAQYFSSYAKYEWAIKLLAQKVRNTAVSEDLLFYYLNLTISNNQLIKRSDYKAVLMNAIGQNKKRFCELFNTPEKGGVTFQLLENKYLKKIYCESSE